MLPRLWQRSGFCQKVQDLKNYKMLTYYLQNEPLPKYFACQGAEQRRRVMLQTKKKHTVAFLSIFLLNRCPLHELLN